MVVHPEGSSAGTSAGRLKVRGVYPDPVHLNSHRCGQDGSVRPFPARFQSLVVVSLNPDRFWFHLGLRPSRSCFARTLGVSFFVG